MSKDIADPDTCIFQLFNQLVDGDVAQPFFDLTTEGKSHGNTEVSAATNKTNRCQ